MTLIAAAAYRPADGAGGGVVRGQSGSQAGAGLAAGGSGTVAGGGVLSELPVRLRARRAASQVA
jgi:hypothetical protein